MGPAEHIRQILAARGLSLYRASQKSAEIFGRFSRFYVPHNLYHDVAAPTQVPTLHQLFALSHITDYRLTDWLAVFGFDLDAISALRLLIPRRHTTLIDSEVYDTHAWIPWFAVRQHARTVPRIAPLGQLLGSGAPRRAIDLLALDKSRFLYGRVGEADVYALPQFAPGSIVRVDARRSQDPLSQSQPTGQAPFFLVEHESGYNCSQLVLLAKDRVLLHSPRHACAQRELQIGKEARILGVVDAEVRPTRNHRDCQPLPGPVPRSPRLILGSRQPTNLKALLQTSRVKVGLSFREASLLSRWIADTLSDEGYFAAASTLSDYETLAAPPRHIQKILTLCVLYCIDFREFLRVSGLPLDQEGHEPMPDELANRRRPNCVRGLRFAGEQEGSGKPAALLSVLLRQWEEIPLFLRYSLEELTGLKNFSLSDVFWVGGENHPIHPLLSNATFVTVNRRVKKPAQFRGDSPCRRPLYVILRRDSGYLCGPCILQQGKLMVQSHPGGPVGSQQFWNGIDAEVVGQVTAIVRRLARQTQASGRPIDWYPVART